MVRFSYWESLPLKAGSVLESCAYTDGLLVLPNLVQSVLLGNNRPAKITELRQV